MKKIQSLIEKIGLKRYLKSLQFRIFIILCVVGIAPILLMKMSILKNYQDQSLIQRGKMLQNQCENFADRMGDSLQGDDLQLDAFETEMEQLATLYNGRMVVVDDEFKVIKDTFNLDEGKTLVSREVIQCFKNETSLTHDGEYKFIELALPIRESVNKQVIGALVISSETADIVENREELSRKVFVLQSVLMLVVLVTAFYLSRYLVKPFARVTKSLEKVSGGFLDGDLMILDYTETREMSEAYNQMLARMKTLDDSRQEFVANVSHELKTPMTSIKVLADSLLAQEDAPAELYREFMEDIASEIDRENQIITDLLALVKMDKKVQDLNIVSLNINDLTELILKRLRPIARKKDVEVVFESVRPVVAEVDEVKMTLIMTNLVENAIKYNKDHGWVKVVLDADHQYFTFEVSDSGIGIPEESLAHICERFYRVDKSHSREIGGTGLGLAITKSAVLMHKGSLTVTSTEGQGSCFLVKIPLTYIAS